MSLFKAKTIKDLFLHLGIILTLTFTLIFTFFYVYLPATTNHEETITVPELEGIHLSEIDEFLTKRNLRYEVTRDSGYSDKYPPKSILKQYPEPGDKVKENRKIYLTLNAENPPEVKMPKLIDGSVKNAQMVLESYNLRLGEIKYVPDLAQNAVLEQWYNGNEIEPGTRIPKGSKINLVVGDGLGNQQLTVPDLEGMEFESAEFVIIGSGLKIGSVIQSNGTNEEIGSDSLETIESSPTKMVVTRQNPEPGGKIRIGEVVDLWLEEKQKQDSTFFDNES